MSKYSFLLETKTEEFFELLPNSRMKKYGGWLVAEAIEQEEISKLQSQATIRAVQLAKRIATAKGIPLDEAFSLLQGGGIGLGGWVAPHGLVHRWGQGHGGVGGQHQGA